MFTKPKNRQRQLTKVLSIFLSTAYILALSARPSSALTKEDCDRIYNIDTSNWSPVNRIMYEGNRQNCYNSAEESNFSNNRSIPIQTYSNRVSNLQAAIYQVEQNFNQQYGYFIPVTRNNVLQMMQIIGASGNEAEFVFQEMSRYSQ